MAIKCASCHADNPETVKFCGECGTQLPGPQGHPFTMTETLQTPAQELTTGSTSPAATRSHEELGVPGEDLKKLIWKMGQVGAGRSNNTEENSK